MTRVVLDTNVIASGSTHPDGPNGQLLRAWRRGAFELVLSEHILHETATTLNTPYFRKRLSKRKRARTLNRLERRAVVTPITADVSEVATHAEDDLVLATAVSGAADFLGTYDKGLLDVGEHERVRILQPHELIQLLRRSGILPKRL